MRNRPAMAIAAILLAACQRQPTTTAPVAGAAPAQPAATATTASPGTAPARPRTAPSGEAKHWQCGELLVDAVTGADAVELRFSGRTLLLPHVESLVGQRYADAAGNAFMRQGATASLALAGGGERSCTPSVRPSPWNEAAGHGVAFRAVGNEPGWLVEVGAGAAPPLHAVLDYGDRSIGIAHVQATPSGYAGTTGDGIAVTLDIARQPCHDGMSGEAFEAAATLQVGERGYRGCGAFLGD